MSAPNSWLLDRLISASPDGVWFASHGITSDLEEAKRKGLSVLALPLGEDPDERELFVALAGALQFPDYFGHNWEAVDECLHDLSWLPGEGIVLFVADSMATWHAAPATLGRLVSAWLSAAARWHETKRPFHLVFA